MTGSNGYVTAQHSTAQHSTAQHSTDLPDGSHGKVELHKDGAKGQKAGSSKEDVRVAGPVGWGHMPGNLVGPGGVSDDWLLGCNHATCAHVTHYISIHTNKKTR